jgi:hypothetical protein
MSALTNSVMPTATSLAAAEGGAGFGELSALAIAMTTSLSSAWSLSVLSRFRGDSAIWSRSMVRDVSSNGLVVD